MENKDKNCKKCIRFATCKFVEENKNFSKSNKMFGMFEHLEGNNLEEIFYKNAPSCKFFVENDIDADKVNEKINGAIYGFEWLKNYLKGFNAENVDHYKKCAIDAIDKYLQNIRK